MKQRKAARRRQQQGLARMMDATERLGLYDAELRQLALRRAGTLTLDELLAQLHGLRSELGGDVPVVVGERGFELAYAVDVVSWPDLDDDELVHRAVRICGV